MTWLSYKKLTMRGNWDESEPLVLAADQHHQQLHQHQPHAQLQKQQHPTTTTTIVSSDVMDNSQQQQQQQQQTHGLPPTPPASSSWANGANAAGIIADNRIVVKEEPQEDKNNDSGISPGHYTSGSASSPASERSLSTANCSLSPGSSSSHDSMQISYHQAYKSCDSPPLDYARANHMSPSVVPTMSPNVDDVSQHSMMSNHQRGEHNLLPNGGELSESLEVSPDPLQCPVCAFSTQSRQQFSQHLVIHCNVASKYDPSEFMKSVMDQLTNGGSIGSPEDMSPPSPQNERMPEDFEGNPENEPGVRVPRVNTQGKVKTFRCKQCSFVAITKLDFWEHSRQHIKTEKLLTCPKCPFVTEYKHHLEYHLRNHMNSKPYKCDKCDYSCVNKSMLNSHLKSHSSIYQFRCADCSYATKYCHSLKLHLRKYGHKPAMVLNSDGSPNPLPIIDIYGTKRGPKTKPKKDGSGRQPRSATAKALANNAMMPSMVAPQPPMPLPRHAQFNQMQSMNALNGFNGFGGMNNGNSSLALLSAATLSPAMVSFPYNQLFAGFPLQNPFSVNGANGNDISDDKQNKPNFMEFVKSVKEEALKKSYSPISFNHGMTITNDMPLNVERPSLSPFNGLASSSRSPSLDLSAKSTAAIESSPSSQKSTAPLDLSKSEHNEPIATSNTPTHSPKTSGTSRRKGRAFKLDRRVFEQESDSTEPLKKRHESMDQSDSYNMQPPPSVSPQSTSSKDSVESIETSKSLEVGVRADFLCTYCQISFRNEIMHTVHMGYHGYKNPFTCNMCGAQCSDELQFFLHLSRDKH